LAEDNPFRRFYEQGGYVATPSDRERRLMALWASHYAQGGRVSGRRDSGSVDELLNAMIALHRACGGRV
jgi:hypothetical protein